MTKFISVADEKGIEPLFSVLETDVLPLNYSPIPPRNLATWGNLKIKYMYKDSRFTTQD